MLPIIQFLKMFAPMLRSGKMSFADALTRFKAQFGRSADGLELSSIKKEVEKAPSNVFDLTGKKIDPSSPIMGGKNVKTGEGLGALFKDSADRIEQIKTENKAAVERLKNKKADESASRGEEYSEQFDKFYNQADKESSIKEIFKDNVTSGQDGTYRAIARQFMLMDESLKLPKEVRKSLMEMGDLQKGADQEMDPINVMKKYYGEEMLKMDDMMNELNPMEFATPQDAAATIKQNMLKNNTQMVPLETPLTTEKTGVTDEVLEEFAEWVPPKDRDPNAHGGGIGSMFKGV
jgi:hypothetical protein